MINSLQELPSSFTNLTNLEFIDFSSNKLTAIPEDFRMLTNLMMINFGSNTLRSFPHFGPKITHIYGELNQIDQLPDSFVTLTNLQELYEFFFFF